MWQKKNFLDNISSERTLIVYGQSDSYDTAGVCLFTLKTLFTWKAILQKYSFLWKQFLVGGKNKLHIYRKICFFDSSVSYVFLKDSLEK